VLYDKLPINLMRAWRQLRTSGVILSTKHWHAQCLQHGIRCLSHNIFATYCLVFILYLFLDLLLSPIFHCSV